MAISSKTCWMWCLDLWWYCLQEKLNNLKNQLKTRVTLCITTNMLQTNKVVADCDKLATKVSFQRFALKVVNFHVLHMHLTCLTCIWHFRWG